MKDIYFANPKGLYFLLLTVGIVGLLFYSLSARKKSLKAFATESSLESLLFLEKRTLFRYMILCSVWFFATLALMQPERKHPLRYQSTAQREVVEEKLVDNKDHEKILVRRRACDVILMLDTSASMRVEDTRQRLSRLDCAKEVIDEIISGLDGQNVALYSFTSALTPVVPPTLDYFFTRLMLKDVHINYGDVAGTDLFEALDQVAKKHFQSASETQKILVVLTDGGDTYLDTLKGEERRKQMELMLSRLGGFEEKNIRIFTVGLGSKDQSVIPGIEFDGQAVLSSLDSELLTELSQKGRGQYYFANDHTAVDLAHSILEVMRSENKYVEQEEESSKKLQRTIIENNPSHMYIQRLFQWPLGLALLLMACELVIPYWPMSAKVDS